MTPLPVCSQEWICRSTPTMPAARDSLNVPRPWAATVFEIRPDRPSDAKRATTRLAAATQEVATPRDSVSRSRMCGSSLAVRPQPRATRRGMAEFASKANGARSGLGVGRLFRRRKDWLRYGCWLSERWRLKWNRLCHARFAGQARIPLRALNCRPQRHVDKPHLVPDSRELKAMSVPGTSAASQDRPTASLA